MFKKGSIPWNKGRKTGRAWNSGKTMEECYGKARANEIKQIISNANTGRVSNRRKPLGVASFNNLLRIYKGSANKRNTEWNLTSDEFMLLT